jgi:hypothetical protein
MTTIRCLIHKVEWGAAVFEDGKPDDWFEDCPVCVRERADRMYVERNKAIAERGTLIDALRIVRTHVAVTR